MLTIKTIQQKQKFCIAVNLKYSISRDTLLNKPRIIFHYMVQPSRSVILLFQQFDKVRQSLSTFYRKMLSAGLIC